MSSEAANHGTVERRSLHCASFRSRRQSGSAAGFSLLGRRETGCRNFVVSTETYPDFGPHVRLSVELTTGFADPRGMKRSVVTPSSPPAHPLCPGAPRSHQRTWDKKDGAKPHQSSVCFLFPHHPCSGAPHLARFLRDVGYHCSAPEALSPHILFTHRSTRTRRLGHPAIRSENTRRSGVAVHPIRYHTRSTTPATTRPPPEDKAALCAFPPSTVKVMLPDGMPRLQKLHWKILRLSQFVLDVNRATQALLRDPRRALQLLCYLARKPLHIHGEYR